MIGQQDNPLLVMTSGAGPARRIELRREYMVVGRDPACDVWLDDPRVSRVHAALRRRGNAVYVTDLDSSGGTFVGGVAVTIACELLPGDVVAFAGVTARFEGAGGAGQHPGTGARWLSWTGLAVLAEGLAIAAVTRLSLGSGGVPDGQARLFQYRLGPSIAGVPAGLLGWALAAVGFGLLIAGIGLHIAEDIRPWREDRGVTAAAAEVPGPARCGLAPRRGA